MNGIPIALALACALLLAVTLWCCLGQWRQGALLRASERTALAAREEQERAVRELRQEVDRLAVDLRERQAAAPPEAPLPRRGVNLSKRSQALRLHRRGDPPRQIATELEVPVQEVELLLKVHEIVMRAL